MNSERQATGRWAVALALAALTALGFFLRLRGIGQSLLGDELFSWYDVHDQSYGQMLSRLSGGFEANPPLWFSLAWLSGKLGDSTNWIRLPSLIAGTALVPAVWLLADRVFNRYAAFTAAALTATSAFAIFYSTEARAYSLLALLVCLAIVVLLAALADGRLRWWIAFAFISAAAAYSHYTAIPVLLVAVIWVVITRRDLLVPLLCSCAASALMFVPWVPNVGNRSDSYLRFGFGPFSASAIKPEVLLKVLPGSPFLPLSIAPGTIATFIFVGALVAASLFAMLRIAARDEPLRLAAAFRSPPALLILLALTSPLAMIIFGASRDLDLFSPRNLTASMPAAFVCIAALLVTGPRRWRWLLPAVAIAITTLATIIAAEPRNERPDARAIASQINRSAKPADPVLWSDQADTISTRRLDIYLHPPRNPRILNSANLERAFAGAERSGSDVWIVIPDVPLAHLAAVPPLRFWQKYKLTSQTRYPGFDGGLELLKYERNG